MANEKPRRTRKLPMVPREHGASFMSVHAWLLGLVGGLVAGGRDWAGLAISLGFAALFLPLAAAASFWSHKSLGAPARRRTVILLAAYAALGIAALGRGHVGNLLSLGAATVGVGIAYVIARAWKGPRSILAELAAIGGIALLAPLTWILIAGPARTWTLSAPAAFLAFGGTVPYVRERVARRTLGEIGVRARLARGTVAIAWQIVSVAAAGGIIAAGRANPLLVVALVPGAVKTIAALGARETRPPIRHIGYIETAVSTVFAILAGWGLGLGPI